MKRVLERNALYLSIGYVLLMWLVRVIRNTIYIDTVLQQAESIRLFVLYALVFGVLTVLIVTLLLRLSKETYKDIGFDTQHLLRQLRNGFLFGALIFFLNSFVIATILEALLPETSAQGIDMSVLFRDIYFLPAWISIAIFKGGFAEELFRIFTLTRFEKCCGKWGLIFALLFGSVMLGFGHYYQGLAGMIEASIRALLYALVYLRKRRAFEAAFAHATFDLVNITLGYLIY